MAGSLLPFAKQIALDNAANPGNGWKFYTYEAGTLTAKATYQDAAMTQANTNPVIANARGEVTMYGSGSYRIILKDASGSTIYDQDNVESPVSIAQSAAGSAVAALAGSSGAASVGFLQSGAGAVARTVQARLRESLSLLDFGAVGDGVEDDADAIAAALAIASGRVIDGLGKAYKVNAALTIPANITLVNAAFDFSSADPAATCLSSSGSLGAAIGLSSDASAGATTLPVSSVSGIAADDWLFLKSSKVFSATSSVTQGEWVRVKAVGASSVDLYAPILHAYTIADAATVQVADFNENIVLDNVSIIGSGSPGNQKGFSFTYCRNVQITNCRFAKTDNRGGELVSSIEFSIDRCVFGDHKETGLAYGVVPASAASFGSITNCWFYNVKHGVASGGSTGVCRDIQVRGCHVYASEGGLDAHPGSEMVTFEDNYIYTDGVTASRDGININGRSAVVRGNRIFHATRYGILFNPTQSAGYTANIIVEGNEIQSLLDTGSGGVFVQNNGGVDMKGVVITGNKIDGYQYGIYARANGTSQTIYGLAISINVIGQVLGPSQRGIFLDCTGAGSTIQRGAISGNVINIGAAANGGIRIVGASSGAIERISVMGNTVNGGAGTAGGVVTGGTDRIAVVGNVIGVSGTAITLVGANSIQANNITA